MHRFGKLKIYIMIKNISSLGKLINLKEQKSITAGNQRLKTLQDNNGDICSWNECTSFADCSDGCSCDYHPSGTYRICAG